MQKGTFDDPEAFFVINYIILYKRVVALDRGFRMSLRRKPLRVEKAHVSVEYRALRYMPLFKYSREKIGRSKIETILIYLWYLQY